MKEMDGVPENGPYQKEVIYPISVIWGIVFAADTINAWYYTIFPEKDKKNPSCIVVEVDDLISIKEVTKQTGITVRTLRYYDQIGLLHPAGKTEGGHRLYGKKELAKLQEIQFLKTL